MEKERVIEIIRKIIIEKGFIHSAQDVNPYDLLFDKYDFTSISIVELIVAIEDEFDFEFEDDEMTFDSYQNIDVIADTVIRHLG